MRFYITIAALAVTFALTGFAASAEQTEGEIGYIPLDRATGTDAAAPAYTGTLENLNDDNLNTFEGRAFNTLPVYVLLQQRADSIDEVVNPPGLPPAEPPGNIQSE